MKALVLLLATLFGCQLGTAQSSAVTDRLNGELPMIGDKVTYTDVVQVDSMPAKTIHTAFRRWFLNAYRSAKDVIQIDDTEAGLLAGKGVVRVQWQVTFYAVQDVNVYHTVTLEARAGRYKYTFTDFIIDYYVPPTNGIAGVPVRQPIESWMPNRPKARTKVFVPLDAAIRGMIADIQSAVLSPSTPENDW